MAFHANFRNVRTMIIDTSSVIAIDPDQQSKVNYVPLASAIEEKEREDMGTVGIIYEERCTLEWPALMDKQLDLGESTDFITGALLAADILSSDTSKALIRAEQLYNGRAALSYAATVYGLDNADWTMKEELEISSALHLQYWNVRRLETHDIYDPAPFQLGLPSPGLALASGHHHFIAPGVTPAGEQNIGGPGLGAALARGECLYQLFYHLPRFHVAEEFSRTTGPLLTPGEMEEVDGRIDSFPRAFFSRGLWQCGFEDNVPQRVQELVTLVQCRSRAIFYHRERHPINIPQADRNAFEHQRQRRQMDKWIGDNFSTDLAAKIRKLLI